MEIQNKMFERQLFQNVHKKFAKKKKTTTAISIIIPITITIIITIPIAPIAIPTVIKRYQIKKKQTTVKVMTGKEKFLQLSKILKN